MSDISKQMFLGHLYRTPLHAAAFTDHVECLQLLLSHNAQVNSVDAAGKTPLMMAAENGQTNAVGMKTSLIQPAYQKILLMDAIICVRWH